MIVRLHQIPEGRYVSIERTPDELARARRIGGQVFDVTVPDGPTGERSPRKYAEDVLARALEPNLPDPGADPEGYGRAQHARTVVVDVTPAPLPTVPEAPKKVCAACGQEV